MEREALAERESNYNRRSMSLSTILFLFLAHLGVGIAFTLVFVSREAGVKFFRFNAGLAAILLVIGLAFLLSDSSRGLGLDVLLLIVATVAITVYWATVGRALASIRPALVAIGVGGGIVALILQAVALSFGGFAMLALTIASVLSSAALLGGTCTGMVL